MWESVAQHEFLRNGKFGKEFVVGKVTFLIISRYFTISITCGDSGRKANLFQAHPKKCSELF